MPADQPGGAVKTVAELTEAEARRILEDIQSAYRSALCYDRPSPMIAEAVHDTLQEAGLDVSPDPEED